jgi:ribosomal protein S18 acetylase RimI-like enzyme/DNA-binding MarR family transcriptional regulator
MDLIRDLGELAIGSRMKRLLERTNRDVSKIYEDLGMDFEARWFSLLYLLNEESPITITGAAARLGYTHPAVNKLAAEMGRKGLLTSSRGRNDRRKRLLRLTAKGRKTALAIKPVWRDIRIVVRDLLESSSHNMLLAIADLERLLDEKPLYDRIFERVRPRLLKGVEVLDYEPRYRHKFKALNYQWLKGHFGVERHDEEVLDDPVGKIIKPGGVVLFARLNRKIVGTCALLKHDAGVFELTKMAVAKEARRRSVGTALTLAIVRRAQALGAKEIWLETHPTMVAAQRLYESLGFKQMESSPIPRRYRRKRIVMKLGLSEK